MTDQALLLETLVTFARRATEDLEVDSLLRDLAHAARAVLAVDGAGVSYRSGEEMLFAHATSEAATASDLAEEAFQQGPCQEAKHTGRVVVEPDVAANPARWPGFTAAAEGFGYRAVAGVPLRARGEVWGAINLYRRVAGDFAPGDLQAAAVLADVAAGFVVAAHDRDAARAAHQVSAHAATHDALTGLPNRVLLYDRLTHATAAAKRTGALLAVVFLDLDDFKVINDTLGHHVGDRVLVEVGNRLAAISRSGDTLARLGGDEFVVVCENLPSNHGRIEPAVDAVIGRIRSAMAEPLELGGRPHVLHASIGVAALGPDRDTPETLLAAADDAMYLAKRGRQSGQDRTVKVIDLPVQEAARIKEEARAQQVARVQQVAREQQAARERQPPPIPPQV